jgi:hypothetical protein
LACGWLPRVLELSFAAPKIQKSSGDGQMDRGGNQGWQSEFSHQAAMEIAREGALPV